MYNASDDNVSILFLVMQNQACLPEECVLMCRFAQSKLEEMWGQIVEAKIVVSDLENVAQHQQNMENLCFAVGSVIKEPRQKQLWSSEIVHTIMQQRITELTAVCSYRKKLKYLCSFLPRTEGTRHAVEQCMYYACKCSCCQSRQLVLLKVTFCI